MGWGLPVGSMLCRPPGEGHGAVDLFGGDQPADRLKEGQTSSLLTSKVVASFTAGRSTLLPEPDTANLGPSRAAAGCSDCRTGAGEVSIVAGVDGVRLPAGGGGADPPGGVLARCAAAHHGRNCAAWRLTAIEWFFTPALHGSRSRTTNPD